MDYYIYSLLLEHYIRDLEYDKLWENLQKKLDDIISDMPKPEPMKPWLSTCSKCGLILDGIMGYCCPQPQCPTGLGGSWCSNG